MWIKSRIPCHFTQSQLIARKFYSLQIPFKDDLSAADLEDFNLSDFLHYKPNEDTNASKQSNTSKASNANAKDELTVIAESKEPYIIISKLKNPFLNLAIEDYFYKKMPLPDNEDNRNYNRLIMYINSPCVVIGRNQNAWSEANVPLLNHLRIPLVRRYSGGGAVVHDLGNANFSFMTSKSNFNRHSFVNIIKNALNPILTPERCLDVNKRGDIVLLENGKEFKVSGSAYRLVKGKAYHHGTMLLNSNLEILKKLLKRTDKNGIVSATSAVDSVKSNVSNINIESDQFLKALEAAFTKEYGCEVSERIEENEEKNSDLSMGLNSTRAQIELLNLEDFYTIARKKAKTFVIEKDTFLNKDIINTESQLREWDWVYGASPKFVHEFSNSELGFSIKFHVEKGALLKRFEFSFLSDNERSKLEIMDSFHYLEKILETQCLEYKGSTIAGFITDDKLSEWIGMSIDGTS